jgi:hypothetical protein
MTHSTFGQPGLECVRCSKLTGTPLMAYALKTVRIQTIHDWPALPWLPALNVDLRLISLAVSLPAKPRSRSRKAWGWDLRLASGAAAAVDDLMVPMLSLVFNAVSVANGAACFQTL